MSYKRPASAHHSEIEINRSRFICYVQPVNNRAEADSFISEIRQRHPKANHNCWSYIAGPADDVHQWNASDDGEPKGTAGQPMLNVLRHNNLGNICAVVTRYFGGIKLGTGGLARAYSQAVQEALKELPTQLVVPMLDVALTAPYDLTGEVEQLISQFKLTHCERSFNAQLLITAKLATSLEVEFRQALTPYQHLIELKIS
ncbi:YigZ family protein [Amphritea japonica]|uniref:Impact N-terminal domain-containing protein n=1 Tax=Amphritea japonica ATCC BAA-1530 TaxID=1278309 RepID=A0A7R6SSL3_9GAMM|nr:YigZ family protein [Amphritea japonica]BBB26459.1 conserved hypothetical protein [Amphritea japonica ATCC BAA-1530]